MNVKYPVPNTAIHGEWILFSEERLIREKYWNNYIRKENLSKKAHTFNNKSYRKMKLHSLKQHQSIANFLSTFRFSFFWGGA